MAEIKINGKTPKEIADSYFKATSYTNDEMNLLKHGFIEGIEYLYPLYKNASMLADVAEKCINTKKKKWRCKT